MYYTGNPRDSKSPEIYQAIDDLAKLSAECVQLRTPTTSCEKLMLSDHTLYLSWDYNTEKNISRLNGFAKVGKKQLFLYDSDMQTYEGEVLCLLDFYVHYDIQGKEGGKSLIDCVLQNEHIEPYQLALDNPSVSLLGFLSQQYGLTKPVWQNTNFVVFEDFFKSIGINGTVERPPEGWGRPQTPRRIGDGTTETRWLQHAISGHASKSHAMNATAELDHSAEGSQANRSHQAKTRKAHNLSSTPLW
ncbi:hypothetical protein DICVIV_06302 [Dictyocaulus viviparus]|uniref:N-acetyltransferase domain-containing protein n=1 Tax=Dictyocaulus viviparus TaxID=29172 RepID=A0A0D8XST0_DICVI|nr:hypothetical protein DICVIV_06302 [Dictyocaulus viviparus]